VLDDISRLQSEHPQWQVGSMWTSAASGPDRRRLWAARGGILVTAPDAIGLSAQITREEQRLGWSAPPGATERSPGAD
jgi:hypothetical protein